MRRTTSNGLLHRVLPTQRCLVRQTGDQVDVDLANASGCRPSNLFVALLAGMQPPDGCSLLVNKRLNSKTDPIHTLPQQLVQCCICELTGSALQSDLGVRVKVERSAQMLKYLLKL